VTRAMLLAPPRPSATAPTPRRPPVPPPSPTPLAAVRPFRRAALPCLRSHRPTPAARTDVLPGRGWEGLGGRERGGAGRAGGREGRGGWAGGSGAGRGGGRGSDPAVAAGDPDGFV